MPKPNHQTNPATAAKARRDKRRTPLARTIRFCRRALFALPILLIALWLLLTRGPAAKSIVLDQLRAQTDARLSADSVLITTDLRVVIQGLTVSHPTITGPEGQFLQVARIDANIDARAILRGDFPLTSIRVDQPSLRVALPADGGPAPIAVLIPQDTEPTGNAPNPPRVEIRGAAIEIAEFTDDNFEVLRSLAFDGDLFPGEDEARVSLTGLAEDARLIADGRLDSTGLELNITGVRLDDFRASQLPSRLRPALAALDLSGQIGAAVVRVDPAGQASATIELERVAVTLPIDAAPQPQQADPSTTASTDPANEPTAPTIAMDGDRPRLQQVSGSLTFGKDELAANLAGRLGPIAYTAKLDAFGFTPTSPLLFRFTTEAFRFNQSLPLYQYIPPGTRRILDRLFINPTGRVQRTEIWITRGPIPQDADPIATAGLTPPTPRPLPDNAEAPPREPQETDLNIAGFVDIEDGALSYRDFPYRLSRIAGRIAFTRQALFLDNLTARTPDDTPATCSGWVGPFGDASQVDIEFTADEVPLSNPLLEALGPNRALIAQLFNDEQHAQLVADRLIAPKGEPGTPETPAFDFGATLAMRLDIQRDYGLVSNWSNLVQIFVPKAGLVPQIFPLPLNASDLVIRIDGETVELARGNFRPIGGGRVLIDADAKLMGSTDPNQPNPGPSITIDAADVPIDDLLRHAIAAIVAADNTDAALTLKDLLAKLNLSGALDARASIGPGSNFRPQRGSPRPIPNDLYYRVNVDLGGLSATPTPTNEPPALQLTDLAGEIDINPARITSTIRGTAAPIARTNTDQDLPSTFTATTLIELPPNTTWEDTKSDPDIVPRLTFTTEVPDLNLAIPFADLLALARPEALPQINDIREQFAPSGLISVEAEAIAILDDNAPPPQITVSAFNARDAAIDALGTRYIMNTRGGEATLNPTTGHLTLQNLAIEVTTNDADLGDFFASGDIPLAIGDPTADPRFSRLNLEIEDGRFESPIIKSLLKDNLSEELSAYADDIDPRGRYDLSVNLTFPGSLATPDPTDITLPGIASPVRYQGLLTPKSLTLSNATLTRESGEVRFDANGGLVRNLAFTGEGFRATAEGAWRRRDDGGFGFLLDPTLTAAGLPQDLLALFPPAIRDVLEAIELDADGQVTLENASLRVDRTADAIRPELIAQGSVIAEAADFNIGVEAESENLRLNFTAFQLPGTPERTPTPATNTPPTSGFDLTLQGEQLKLAGIRLTDANLELLSGHNPGEILIPTISANAHGGRLSGNGRIDPPTPITSPTASPNPDNNTDTANKQPEPTNTETPDETNDPQALAARIPQKPRYAIDLALADVRLAEILNDLSIAAADRAEEQQVFKEPERAAPTGTIRPSASGLNDSRGRLNARVALFGDIGDPETTRGRGRVSIADGPVLVLPFLTQLIELSNLQVPSGDVLGLAEAEFYLRHDEVTIERVSVLSERVEILGYGSLTLPEANLDMRFRSRGLNRIPIISNTVEQIRDELLTTVVEGPIGSPNIRTEQLPATSRVISRLLGLQPDPRAERLREIERDARLGAERARRTRRAAAQAQSREQPPEPTPEPAPEPTPAP